MLDLVIRGGTIVTSGSVGIGDIGVQDGTIVQIGGDMRGRHELDVRDKYVLPGGVDVHVHLSSPVKPEPGVEQWVDEFYSGSRAAIAGGVTTIGNMTFPWMGETLRDALARDLAAAERDAAVDYVLYPVLSNPSPEALAQIPALATEGHTSLKIFMALDNFDAYVNDYLQAMRLAATSGMLMMLHCEDGALIRYLFRELMAQELGALEHFPESRPDYTELAATERAIAMACSTGASIYIVHLSSAAALASCRRARADGLPIYVETRPLYLYLTQEVFDQPDGAKYVGMPPLRQAIEKRRSIPQR